ncbi:MAG: ParB/RepB/Spo0J family partition protein [Gemmatimonadaceae bacterium]|nr:ParB/RepB/Spo0J family partition protein [Gemmatimonadaceae bacterium]
MTATMERQDAPTNREASMRAMERAGEARVEAIGLSLIDESPDNPRKHFPAAWIDELAASMLASGQLTHALVRPNPKAIGRYELAAGATRLRAARKAGLTHLQCVVRPLGDAEFLEALTFENLKRRDLQPMEEARGYALLQKRLEGWTVEKIAERSGVSVDYVRDRLRLLKLDEKAVSLLEDGRIELGHALELAKIGTSDQKRAIKEGLFQPEGHAPDELKLLGPDNGGQKARTVRELRAWIDRNVRVDLAHPELEHLLPATAAAIETATAAKRRQVFIAFGHVDPRVKGSEKVIGPLSWKRAENEQGQPTCDYAVLGIVFAGDASRGHALLVCTNKDRCKRHWPQHVKRREDREKARRGELTSKAGKKVSEAEVARKQREQQAKEDAARKAQAAALTAATPELLDALFAAIAKAKPLTLLQAIIKDSSDIREPLGKSRLAKLPSRTVDDLVRRLFAQRAFGGYFRLDDSWTFEQRLKPMAKQFGIDAGAILKKHTPKAEAPKAEQPTAPPKASAAPKAVKVTKAPKKKVAKRQPAAQFMQPVTPDAKLAAVVGTKPMPRTELIKKLWAYIRKHGLQDKKNRRMIKADEKLRPIFGGKDAISMFDMTKAVTKHLVKAK